MGCWTQTSVNEKREQIPLQAGVHAGPLARQLLFDHAVGNILSVHTNCCYVTFSNGRLLLLHSEYYGIIPFAIQLPNLSCPKQSLTIGMKVYCMPNSLEIPEAGLKWEISIGKDPNRKGSTSWTNTATLFSERFPGLQKLFTAVLTNGSKAGLGDLLQCLEHLRDASPCISCQKNLFCQTACPYIRQLLSGLQTGDHSKLLDGLEHLLGLGIGLTPSGDDFLCGFLYALLRLEHDKPSTQALSNNILALAPTHTGKISAAYLKAVADGWDFSLLDNFLQALFSEENCSEAADSLLQIGSSSGGEMALGILTATVCIVHPPLIQFVSQ